MENSGMASCFRNVMAFVAFAVIFLSRATADTYLYDANGSLVRSIGDDGKSVSFTPDLAKSVGSVASQQPVAAVVGQSVLLSAQATALANPASTGITAVANLSQIGGSASAVLNDAGTGGDVTAGDGIYSSSFGVPAATAAGVRLIGVTFTDAQGRSWQDIIALDVRTSQPVPALPMWAFVALAVLLVVSAGRRLPARP